ncbi:SDR family NAD(P)-dependent oxidoreductase [Polaromonas sp. YR568]|uniref:SDR family NAD(P)-dependent oxidoreductase n=1 Tax=Polaromonas sp. YR568 TaxID=1855301 RepID=UPI00398C207F
MSTSTSKGTALITGASSGIGAIYAERLARRGYDLVLVARDRQRLQALSQELAAQTGRKVETLQADLTVKADVLKIEQRLAADKTLTLLVNNAGLGATAPLVDSSIDAMDEMIQLNVVALTRLTHAALPGLLARGQGAIINIASIVALAPELLNGVYGGTKAYVLAFTQSLHHEVGAKGVQVQAVLPGAISTPFWNRAGVPVEHLPQHIVMQADELVDAALSGFDQRELVTIPSLPDAAQWEAFSTARLAMGPGLSLQKAAQRYQKC